MKITKRKLQRIIKEEMQAVLSEMPVPALGALAGSYTVEGFAQNVFVQSLLRLAEQLDGIADRAGLKADAKISVELEAGDIILAGAPGVAGDYDSKNIDYHDDTEYSATIAKVKRIAKSHIRKLHSALKRGYNPRIHANYVASFEDAGQEAERYRPPAKIRASEMKFYAGGTDLAKKDAPDNSGYMTIDALPVAFGNINPAKLAAVLRSFVDYRFKNINTDPVAGPRVDYPKGSVLNKFKVGGDEDGVQGRMRAQRVAQEPE